MVTLVIVPSKLLVVVVGNMMQRYDLESFLMMKCIERVHWD